MKKIRSFVVLALTLGAACLRAASYAENVISYDPGSGFAAGFTNAATSLGAPSQINPFGDPVDPFNSPYGQTQLVSLGVGGSLTVQFLTPIANNPNNRFGIDFMIFGNTGFVITNATDTNFNFIGTPATDGSLYGNNPGATRVAVSADGINYYTLNPSVSPVVDGIYPTDGAADFGQPVNPSLQPANFAGKTLDGIRTLYAGSGGGTGFDIGSAQDSNSNAVVLPTISYVRVSVLSGKSEIDAFSAVTPVPEPAIVSLLLAGSALLILARRRK
jgi:hypothetical protein